MHNIKPSIKKLLITAVIVLLVLVIVLFPYIVEWLYYHVDPPFAFFDIQMEPDAIIQYFGAVLAFFATVVLGALTLRQNKIAQDQTNEVNRLNLDIAKKNMERATAKEQEDEEARKIKLKFEVKIQGYFGHYVNTMIMVRNLTEYFVSDFRILSVDILKEDGSLIESVNVSNFKLLAFQTGETKEIKLGNKEALRILEKRSNSYPSKSKPFKNVKFEMKFSCQDKDFKGHYFEASKTIISTDKIDTEPWECREVAVD